MVSLHAICLARCMYTLYHPINDKIIFKSQMPTIKLDARINVNKTCTAIYRWSAFFLLSTSHFSRAAKQILHVKSSMFASINYACSNSMTNIEWEKCFSIYENNFFFRFCLDVNRILSDSIDKFASIWIEL